MVKSLVNICFTCLQNHVDKVQDIGRLLPTRHKEVLLERIMNHDRLTLSNTDYIQTNLLTSSLCHVTLYRNQQINFNLLKHMGRQCYNLVTLCIHGCPNVTDAGISALLAKQKNLETLKVIKLPLINGEGLSSLKCDKLTTLNLRGCSNFTVQGLSKVLSNNSNISCLCVSDCSKLDRTMFTVVARKLNRSLEEFSGCPHPVGDEDIIELAHHCPNLKKLSLLGCARISGKVLLELSMGCIKLENLDLSYCYALKDAPDNQSLWLLPTLLTDLSLCGIILTDEQILLECFQRLKHLKCVRLCGIPAVNDNTLPKILQFIGKSLKTLDLSGARTLTDEGLKSVTEHCEALEELDLSMCPDLTCESLIPLAQDQYRASLITKLFVCCKKMNVDFLYSVATRCINLEKLDMAGLKCVTDDLLCTVARNCPHLLHLGIKGCSEVTDISLCDIARYCPLRSLVISGIFNITDKSIFAVANSCHYLEEIYLNGCSRVSPTTMTYLKDCCIPRLYVQHKTPNIGSEHLMGKNLDTGEFCRMDQFLEPSP